MLASPKWQYETGRMDGSSFGDIIFALDFPESFTPPTDTTPTTPGAVVRIPDPNLRAAIAEELGKGPNTPITVEDMEGLERIEARNKDIQDLTGLQFSTNLRELLLNNNQVSDLSPIAGLITLRVLDLWNNPVSDLSSVRGLKNLYHLSFGLTSVSDLSPVAGLINLEDIHFYGAPVSDLSPLAGLINLKSLAFSSERISDLSPVAGLINLGWILTWGSPIADLSPVAGLANLWYLEVSGAEISDLTPVAGLTNLTELRLHVNDISDLSPLAGLTKLNRLELGGNNISDLSPLAGLTNLKWLRIDNNQISDLSPLDRIRENIKLLWHNNPGFPKGGPKIEGPWLWAVLPGATGLDTDMLSETSGGTVTETEIATHGAIKGGSVGDSVWTSYRLPPTGKDNIADMLKQSIDRGVIYGSVSLHSPREQKTTMYVGSNARIKVWLNGALIHHESHWRGAPEDYTDFFPVTLEQGRNVLLVALAIHGNGFFGFEPGTEYTVSTGVGYTFFPTPIHLGDTFTLDIRAESISDLAGWQFDIVFDPASLEAVAVTEGDFLKTDSGNTFFQSGSIDNAAGKITGLSAIRLSTQGATGTGTVLQVRFKAKSSGETELTLQNFEFASITGEHIPAVPQQIYITVEEQLATGDVNRDGRVSILDLVLIAQQFGQRVPANSPVDLNGDGVVSILDLVLAIREIDNTTALAPPAVEAAAIDPAMIEAWIAQARLEDDGSLVFKQGIENTFENLLALTDT